MLMFSTVPEALDSVDAIVRAYSPVHPACAELDALAARDEGGEPCRQLIPDDVMICSELGAELLLDEVPDAPALPEPTLAAPTLAARRSAFVKALVDGEPAVATLAAAGRAGFDQLELASDALEIMRRNRAFWSARGAVRRRAAP